MSPRRGFRPPRRRAARVRPSTDAAQGTRSQTALAADARHEGLAVTHRFDPGDEGQPYAATVQFRGRRERLAGKPLPGDTFTVEERVDPVVPGSGPISVTTRAYGLNPGEWTVTAELLRGPGRAASRPTAAKGGPTLPRARWSWLRWRLTDAPFGPVRTRWSPFVRLTAMPAVIHGSWTALVGLGVVIGIGALLWFLSLEGIAAGPALIVLDLPVLAVLDAGAPAFFVGVGIGRLGCFLTGCCAGR